MIRRVWLASACLSVAGAIGSQALAQSTTVTWDGGNAEWKANKWNGGQDANTALGRNNGVEGAYDVFIGDGSQVAYDAKVNGDFRVRALSGSPASLTIHDGAALTLNSFDTDPDGKWTQIDGDLTLDNGTFNRGFTPSSTVSGGVLMFGSWNSFEDQQINVVTKNGGSFQNDGQVWFGATDDHGIGLKVSATINNGTWDLTGGDNLGISNDDEYFSHADLSFWYGFEKQEDYEINFQGPGSLTVDEGGIVVYREDSNLVWDQPPSDEVGTAPLPTLSSYQDLWDQGILKAKGISGKIYPSDPSPRDFNNYFIVDGNPGDANYKVTRKEGATVTWSGGAGNWNSAEWDTTGGASNQLPQDAFGRTNGSEGGHNIVISGAGVDVVYDQDSDFRLQNNNGFSSMTVKSGASLTLDSTLAVDGRWTRWIEDLTVDGGTFRRTKSGAGVGNGGAFMLGAFGAEPGQEINVNVVNGGRIENDGQLWFGTPDDGFGGDYGLEVTMTINNGTIDLTGGDSGDIDLLEGGFGAGVEPDLLFWYGLDDELTPLGESYAINFTGSGSITVDHSGIWIGTQQSDLSVTAVNATYEELWTRGILQANGVSGLDGATFGDFFTTSGTLGNDNYMLTSLLTSGLSGDFDVDGDVDGADFLLWQRGGSPNPLSAGDLATWKANFGASATVNGSAAVGAVPEPASLLSAMVALCGLGLWRSRR